MAGGGIGEAALLGAAMGGGAAAVTGGDPLKGAMLGGVTGAVGSQFSLLGGGGGGAAGSAGAAGAGSAGLEGAASTIAANPAASMAASNLSGAGIPGALPTSQPGLLFRDPLAYIKANPFTAGASGLAGAVGARPEPFQPGEYDGPLGKFRYDPDTYKPMFANGGITALAGGGISDLGGYSDGGQLLKGPGDGVSDSIPAVIGGKQPARLATGEFVVPARIVSELGNGSTDAGAKQLYAMIDRIQRGRKKTMGKNRVAVNTRSHKALPA